MPAADHENTDSAIGDDGTVVFYSPVDRDADPEFVHGQRHPNCGIAMGRHPTLVDDVDTPSVRKKQSAIPREADGETTVRLDTSRIANVIAVTLDQHSKAIIADDLDDALVREVGIPELGQHANVPGADELNVTAIEFDGGLAPNEHGRDAISRADNIAEIDSLGTVTDDANRERAFGSGRLEFLDFSVVDDELARPDADKRG